jgi:hypothetical protein
LQHLNYVISEEKLQGIANNVGFTIRVGDTYGLQLVLSETRKIGDIEYIV